MRAKLNEEEQSAILDSVNALIDLRHKRNKQVSSSIPKDNGGDCEVNGNNLTDNLIISKDFYDECGSSDDSIDESDKQNRLVHDINSESEDDSSVNGSLKTSPLISEIKSDSEDDSKDGDLVHSINQQLQKSSAIVEITQKKGNNKFQIDHNGTKSESSDDLSNEQKEEFLENKTMNVATETCSENVQMHYPTNVTDDIRFIFDNEESNQGNGDSFEKKVLVLNKNNNNENKVEGLQNLEVTDDNMGIEKEYNLSVTHKPNTDTNNISIKLPWKQLDNNKEFHIRQSFK